MQNRIVKVASSTGVSVPYVYDAQNHRVKRMGKDGMTVYAYGRNGALAYQKNLTTGFERSCTYLTYQNPEWLDAVAGTMGSSGRFFWTNAFTYSSSARMTKMQYSNGIVTTYEYDTAGRLNGIGDANNTKQWYDIKYNKADSVTNKNKNVYEYNELRRLTKVTEENAITQNKPVRAETVVSDYDGQRTLTLAAKDTEIALDAGGASLGKSFPGKVELLGCIVVPLLKTHRVDDGNLVVYLRDGSTWKRCAPEEYELSLSADSGAIEIAFKTKRTTSGIMVHCLWDERNLDYTVNESHSNFKNRSDRILTLHYIDTNRVITYTYDAEGNRTAETLSDSVAGNTTKTYTYWANTNWLKTDGTNEYVYDKLGKLIEKGTNYTISANTVSWSATSGIYWKYDYDLWGHLIQVQKGDKGTNSAATIMSATYDAGGILRTKTKGSRTWRYWYGTDGNMVHQTMKDSSNASLSWEKGFVYIAGKLAGYSETRSGVTKRYWVQTDQLGTVVRETDETGKVVAAQEYATFGTNPGSVASGTHEMLQWYTGKEWDGDVGLYYFNARWYDPDIGRFITEDPARDDSNWYVYCLNSPETWVDPSGLTSNPISGAPGADGRTEVTFSDGTKQSLQGTGFPSPNDPSSRSSVPDTPVANLSINNDGSISIAGKDGSKATYAGRRGTLANGQTKSITSPEQGTVPAPTINVGYEDPMKPSMEKISLMDPLGLKFFDKADFEGRPETSLSQEKKVEPRYFQQRMFSIRFGIYFGEHACAATSLLNELSELYTEKTNKQLNFPQATKAIQAAIDAEGIRGFDAYINNWQDALTAMFKTFGLPSKVTYDERGDHLIYASDNDMDGEVDHFTNSFGNDEFHNPWNGKIGDVDDLQLQRDRPTRGFSYSQ